MKVYVDFDRTLFDCDKFLEDFYAIIAKYNINRTMFKECQNQSKRKGFNPYTILNNLEKKVSFDKAIYQEIDELINNTEKYLFSDAKPFLEYLKKKGYHIIILTRGNSDYQREKIFNARLDKYYEKLIVTMHHKGLLFLNYFTSIFIDDNPREIKSLLLRNPKIVICIRHNNIKELDIHLNKRVFVVSSLNEIIEKGLI